MQEALSNMYDTVGATIGAYVPNLVGALAILVLGWIVALVVSALVRGVLRKTKLDEKIAGWIFGPEERKKIDVARNTGKGVYYVIILFVLVAFFQALGITLITEPINSLLNRVFEFAPRIVGAGILLLIAWILASVLRIVLTRAMSAGKIDERFGGQAGLEEDKVVPLSKSLGDAVYWLIFLLFLPAILSSLALQGLLDPVRGMTDKILGFLPHIVAAGVILFAGWFVARVVQRLLTNLLSAAGLDGLSERAGISRALGSHKLSGLVGYVVYFLIFVPILVAALNALKLEAVTQPASDILHTIIAALPHIFAAALVLIISYIVGRVVAELVKNLLEHVGFNAILMKIGLAKESPSGGSSPAGITGSLVLAAIMLFAVVEALDLLGFGSLSNLVTDLLVFAGHVIFGLVIFGIGLYLAKLVSDAITASGTSNANLIALVAKVSIAVLAGAMALRQMGVANDIVNLGFGIIVGAIAVAAAVAFGIGGRDLAAKKLNEWHQSLVSKGR